MTVLTVFLDRDGVINVDSPDYIKSPSEFHFIPGSPEAVARLSAAGCRIILITNQSVIHRKMVSRETLAAIFDKCRRGVAEAGGQIDDIFFCPHTPEEGCGCRKPRPGMILEARERYAINLERSCMVGDSAKDILCAQQAGCGASVLVETGNGRDAIHSLRQDNRLPDHVAADLWTASQWILRHLCR